MATETLDRREILPAPPAADWHKVQVALLEVTRKPFDEVVGQRDVKVARRRDDDGWIRYRDPQTGEYQWCPEGEQPKGWEPELVDDQEDITRPSNGTIAGVQIIEEDADGNPIALDADGYAAISQFAVPKLRALAQQYPSAIGAHYGAIISHIKALTTNLHKISKGINPEE